MDEIIRPDFNTISLSAIEKLRENSLSGLISEADEDTSYAIAEDHAAEPIKKLSDIEKISKFLISNRRYRDNMLFIVGINFGLRVSDLVELRFSHLINENFVFKQTFPVFEKKTRNTRKHKKNRYITINTAVIEAVTLYLEHTDGVKLSDYLFRSESNHGGDENSPLHRNSVDRILKGIDRDLGLGIHMSTHTLRKTFAYHQMAMCNNDPRKLMLLSKMMGHSSITITLDYIGLTDDEIQDAYANLNLGSGNNYINSNICESVQLVG